MALGDDDPVTEGSADGTADGLPVDADGAKLTVGPELGAKDGEPLGIKLTVGATLGCALGSRVGRPIRP